MDWRRSDTRGPQGGPLSPLLANVLLDAVDAAAKVASNARRWWKNSGMLIHVAFPISYFDQLGIPRLAP